MIKWSQGEHLVCDEFGWLQWKAEDHNHYSAQFISSVLALSPLDTDCKKFLLKLISDESCIRFQVERVSLGDDYPIKRLYNGLYVKLGVKVWSSACGLHHKKLLILRYWWGIIMKCFFNFLVQKELFNTLYPLNKNLLSNTQSVVLLSVFLYPHLKKFPWYFEPIDAREDTGQNYSLIISTQWQMFENTTGLHLMV